LIADNLFNPLLKLKRKADYILFFLNPFFIFQYNYIQSMVDNDDEIPQSAVIDIISQPIS